MNHPKSPISVIMWDLLQAEMQLASLAEEYDHFRAQIPEEFDTQTILFLDELRAVKSRIASAKFSAIALCRQEK